MLEKIIRKNLKHFTTSCTSLVLLDEVIVFKKQESEDFGLTIPEISERYFVYKERFDIRKNFYPSYVQRHLKENDIFEEFQGKYRIQEKHITNLDINTLEHIRNLILSGFSNINISKRNIIEELDNILNCQDKDEIYKYIFNLFDKKGFNNYGQMFEIVSFSILSIYFKNFGFNLNRFSTSFSNDGGMDYISSNGIYQVTSSPDANKIKSDLEKLQGIKRVLVFSYAKEDIIRLHLASPDVTEIITSIDLKDHFLKWIHFRDLITGNNLKSVISLIRKEFVREL